MSAKELLQRIGDADPAFIEEAAKDAEARLLAAKLRRKHRITRIAMAAAAVVILAGAGAVWRGSISGKMSDQSAMEYRIAEDAENEAVGSTYVMTTAAAAGEKYAVKKELTEEDVNDGNGIETDLLIDEEEIAEASERSSSAEDFFAVSFQRTDAEQNALLLELWLYESLMPEELQQSTVSLNLSCGEKNYDIDAVYMMTYDIEDEPSGSKNLEIHARGGEVLSCVLDTAADAFATRYVFRFEAEDDSMPMPEDVTAQLTFGGDTVYDLSFDGYSVEQISPN